MGVPKEVKAEEYRVGVLPMAAGVFTKGGHQVLVQATAGDGSGFTDEEYIEAGATMVSMAEEVYDRADMIYQVEEPFPSEYPLLKEDQIHFRYFHLAVVEVLPRRFETLASNPYNIANAVKEADGKVTNKFVAESLGLQHTSF